MVKSMTGFGRAEVKGLGYSFSVEMKSVNHRFLEVMVKLPRTFNVFEEGVRKIIQNNFQRGRIEVFINIKETEEKKRLVKVDKELALSYDNSLKELAQALGTVFQSDVYRLSSLPDVLSVEEDETDSEALWVILEKGLNDTIDSLIRMRIGEGANLAVDIDKRLKVLHSQVQQIAERAPQVVIDYRDKLNEKLNMLLADSAIDENRLAMEVVLFADRAAIDEELVRLESHLEQFRQALATAEPVGRKLDFLVQELNREINTIGSKANDLLISRIVVELKSELEKIREQIQNIE